MIRVLVADSSAAAREDLRARLAAEPDVEVVGLARDGHEAVQMAHALRPEVALLAADLAVRDGYQAAEWIAAAGLPTCSILLSADDAGDGLRRAMRAGAREHLAWPSQAARLGAALRAVSEEQRRRQSAAFAEAGDPQKMTRIIAVSGAKGGVGKTTIAVNLALALLRETGRPTTLVDLYTQFGDVAMLLNLSPRHSLAELAAHPAAEVDAALLDDHTERHESGLRVLVGAASPVALDAISEGFLDRVFGMLKASSQFVVLDVPPILHPTTLHALSHAAQVLLVANLYDLTTVKDTRLLLEAIEGRYVAREKLGVVLNRVSRHNRLCLPDIERALGHPIAAQVPNDGRVVPQSINQGVPFVLSQPHSAVAQSVGRLACQVAEGGPPPPASGADGRGFWRRPSRWT